VNCNAAVGRNMRIHADSTEEMLPSEGTWNLQRGGRLRIETPGRGGWGEPA
jgi:N-methylhydantoinase B/oxoprolinase/acetone carboxylase alpha subunit